MDVSEVDTSTTIMSTKIALPLGIAPAAMHGLAHPEGELATSKAAASAGIPMGLSTYSTTSMEDVIHAGTGNPYAMQISITTGLEHCERLIKRAEGEHPASLIMVHDARPVV